MRVLFTSGYTENAIIHHGRLDEGVHLLAKPHRRKDLAEKVRHVLDEVGIPDPYQETAVFGAGRGKRLARFP